MDKEETIRLTELNRKILEIKKKIQLSEGQRRALFEDCEAERKANADNILQLKKEISNLVIVFHESVSPVAKYRLQNRRLEQIVGPLLDKSCDDVKKLLDLHIIDQNKKLDILKYQIKKRQDYIVDLGTVYQKLVSKEEKKELIEKVDKPVNKSSRELQNNIHAVEVQIREAIHIRHKYNDIRRSLKDDAAKFASRIKSLEEQLQLQSTDTQKLQKILLEASKRKGTARRNLLREERLASSAANQRECEASEGRRLVGERKVELEKLEKRLFISGKFPLRSEPDGAESDNEEDTKSSSPPHPVENMAQEFDLLKKATGGSSVQEVLDHFSSQRATYEKLNELRSKSENEKKTVEKRIESLKQKLDGYKYYENRESDKKFVEMERAQQEIQEQRNKSEQYKKEKLTKEQALGTVSKSLHSLRLLANPLCSVEDDIEKLLKGTLTDIGNVIEKYHNFKLGQKSEDIELSEPVVEHLPTPYSGLIRRSPQPQMSGSPSPGPLPASDDEEEVPSRSFLKRQAQLVIDAKSRRKNLRIQLPKRI